MTDTNEPTPPNADLLKNYIQEAYAELEQRAVDLHAALARADTPEKQLTLIKLLNKHVGTIEERRKSHGRAYSDSKKVIDQEFGRMSVVLVSDLSLLREAMTNHLRKIGGDNPEIRDEYNHMAKFRKVKAWRVKSLDAVPREFLNVDTDDIKEAMDMEMPIPGIEYYEKEELTVS